MATLRLNDVPEEIFEKLCALAKRNGISIEEQHLRLLSEALSLAIRRLEKTETRLFEQLCAMPDVGEDWMFDRHDPRNATPERREQLDFGKEE
jgi:hypothetical protein